MKFLAVSTNTRDVTPYLAEEGQRVAELQSAGTVTNIWLKADFSGAVIVLECASKDEAEAVLGTFPIARHGATTIELTALADMDAAPAAGS
jgi:muconolactone delta-isomerase